MTQQVAAETRFALLDPAVEPAPGMRTLVRTGSYDIRRVSAGPGQAHGPGRHEGDACVLLLAGTVEFAVDGRAHRLAAGDLLWVPARALRGFVAGPEGAVLLAIHLPAGRGGRPPAASAAEGENPGVIAHVAAHHAQMSAELDDLASAVVQSADAAGLDAAIGALVGYLRREVLPHAAAEETTFYDEARTSAGAAALIDALVLEHRDLQTRVEALAALRAAGNGGAVTVGTPDRRARAVLEAVTTAALFHLHARKENEVVLPVLATAGVPLAPILARMAEAFAAAAGAVEATDAGKAAPPRDPARARE